VSWKDTPTLFGLESFVAVANETEANQRRVRSYSVQAPKYMDTTKDGVPDVAIVGVNNWEPAGADLEQWGEIYIFAIRNCVVGSTLVILSGAKAVTP
jgi:hypothetical protein